MLEFYIIVGGLLIGVLIAFSARTMIWAVLLLSLVVAPLSVLLSAKLDNLHWGVTMLYAWMWFVLVFRVITGKVEDKISNQPFGLHLFFLVLFVAALSTAYSRHFAEALAASKNYLQAWVLPFFFFYLVRNEKSVRPFVIAILLLAALQPIVAGYQQFTLRGTYMLGDRIGGTFGTEVGAGIDLSMFLLAPAFIVLAMVRDGILRLGIGVPLFIWIFLPLFWTHAKAVIFFIPIGVALLFYKEIMVRPLFGLGLIAVGFLSSLLLAQVYVDTAGLYRTDPSTAARSISELVDGGLNYAVRDKGNIELNRGTSLTYWAQSHASLHYPLETLFGHGLGATKETGRVEGHLMTTELGRPGMGSTALARLLWEMGLVGTILFSAIFVWFIRAASRLSGNLDVPLFHRATLSGFQVSLIIYVLSLLYNKAILDHQTFSTFVTLILGYIAFWYRVCGKRI